MVSKLVWDASRKWDEGLDNLNVVKAEVASRRK
jgi:hypothetical protein